jgi:polygalacturonase
MALVLEKGAVVQATGKFADAGLPDPLPETQKEISALRKQLKPLISGARLEDVAILGEGIIDGAGAPWWAKSDIASKRAAAVPATTATKDGKPAPPPPLYVPRPHLVTFHECARVHIQGVTLRNSPMFHLVPYRCHDILVEDVHIHSPDDSPNTDGIDPANCQNVLIRHCTIDTGDDNIALKAGSGGGLPTENITVTDCTLLHGHGVSVGSETDTGVRHFLVRHCTFENTVTALRIKSDRTRGGVVEDVTCRDITMKNVDTAISIFLYYDDKKASLRPEPQAVTDSTPFVKNIHFLNITCDGATKRAGEIMGLPESPATDITLENVRITGAAGPFTQQDTKNLRFLNVDVQTVPATAPAKEPPAKP